MILKGKPGQIEKFEVCFTKVVVSCLETRVNHEAMMLACDFIFEEVTDDLLDRLELRNLGFTGTKPSKTGRPGYDPRVMIQL